VTTASFASVPGPANDDDERPNLDDIAGSPDGWPGPGEEPPEFADSELSFDPVQGLSMAYGRLAELTWTFYRNPRWLMRPLRVLLGAVENPKAVDRKAWREALEAFGRPSGGWFI
jgi:hypothetical protein